VSGCSGEPVPQAGVEDLEEKKPKRGAGVGEVDPKPNATLPRAAKSLGVEATREWRPDVGVRESVRRSSVSSRGANGKGAGGSRRESTAARGEKPLNGENPGRGCEMKQARKARVRRKPSRG
jgi:hypothetical protein